MTEGQVKAKLNRYQDARERYNSARAKLEETENLITGISIDYSKDRVQASPKSWDRIGDLIDRLTELRKVFRDEAWQAIKEMDETVNFIQKVGDGRLESILVKKYILGETWEKIGSDLGFTERHLFRLQDEAINILIKKSKMS